MTQRRNLTGFRAIDTMVAIPEDPETCYDRLLPLLRTGGRQVVEKPLAYLYKSAPKSATATDDLLGLTLAEMARFGVHRAMIQLVEDMLVAQKALREYPDQFLADYVADASKGTEAPSSISMERSFTELVELSVRDHAWPLFPQENAVDAFKLDASAEADEIGCVVSGLVPPTANGQA
jgi:hypothetical protein